MSVQRQSDPAKVVEAFTQRVIKSDCDGAYRLTTAEFSKRYGRDYLLGKSARWARSLAGYRTTFQDSQSATVEVKKVVNLQFPLIVTLTRTDEGWLISGFPGSDT